MAWALWSVRVELALVLALVGGSARWSAGVLGDVGGVGRRGWSSRRCWRSGRLARFVLRLLRAMRVRRAWARATIDSGVAAGPFRCPGVWSVARVPAGDLLDVRVRRGQSVAELDARARALGRVPARA